MRTNIKKTEQIVYRAVLDGELEIDQQGRVWRVAKRGWDRWNQTVRLNKCEKVRAEHPLPLGYLQVRAMYDKKRSNALAHRLIYLHFHGPIPDGMTVNHKNGIKNDNRPSNLELMTDSEQQMHARRILKVGRLDQSGERNAMAKLTLENVKEIRQRRLNGESLKSIAEDFSVGLKAISKIARLQRWTP